MTTTVSARHLIAGRWRGEPQHPREDPAPPGEVVSLSAVGGQPEVDEAVAAAERAFPTWRATVAPARGAILVRAAELLTARTEAVALDLCAEEGKTLTEARAEVHRAADIMRYQAGTAWRLGGETFPSATPNTVVMTAREPLGVVALITPWNFPIAIPTWELAPALIAGNTLVLKPAGLTPLSVQHLARCLVDAGMPEGVLNVVLGPGSTVGRRLVEHSDVAAVSFTGSLQVGRQIETSVAARHARIQLEMGGKNAMVVLRDADPKAAARHIAVSAFGLTGQACTATSRVIVERSAHNELIKALCSEALHWSPVDGRAEGARMGPVVSGDQLRMDCDYIDLACGEGAEPVFGGHAKGQFLEPTVLVGVSPRMRIAREEVFGPVVAVLDVDDLDQAIAVANDSQFGLTAGIVTNDLAAAMRFSYEVEAGVIKVNRPTAGLDLNVPFGGMKDSSTATFREQGPRAVDFYSRERTIYLGS